MIQASFKMADMLYAAESILKHSSQYGRAKKVFFFSSEIEAMEYILDSNNNDIDENNNYNNMKQLVNCDAITAGEFAADCDAMLFISPKHVPTLPKNLSRVLQSNESMVFNRWYLQGVSCFLTTKRMNIAMAQFVWKTLRKFETNSLRNVLGPWRRYEWKKQNSIQETALPSI